MDGNESRYRAWLDARDSSGLLRELKQAGVETPGCVTYGGGRYVNFSGNDYLGLSRRGELILRAREWAELYGTGAGASRLVTGNLEVFEGIEKKIADLKGSTSSLVMAGSLEFHQRSSHDVVQPASDLRRSQSRFRCDLT